MKKVALLVVALFLLVAILDGILQNGWVQRELFLYATKNLEKSGWKIEVKTVTHHFPRIDWNDVRIEKGDFRLSCQSLKGSISLLALFKRELEIKHLEAEEIYINNTLSAGESLSTAFKIQLPHFHLTNVHFKNELFSDIKGSLSLSRKKITTSLDLHWRNIDWSIAAYLKQGKFGTWSIEKGRIENPYGRIKIIGQITSEWSLDHAAIEFLSTPMRITSPFAINGTYLAHLHLSQKEGILEAKGHLRTSSLSIDEQPVSKMEGEIQATYQGGILSGKTSLDATFRNLNWKGSSDFSWDNEKGWAFSSLLFDSIPLHVEATLYIAPETAPSGNVLFTISDLHPFYSPLYGASSGNISWKGGEEIVFEIEGTHLQYKNRFLQKIKIRSDLRSVFEKMSGTLQCDVENGGWKSLAIQSAHLETSMNKEGAPFSCQINGTWQHPFHIETSGLWDRGPQKFACILEKIDGTFFDHSLQLTSPSSFVWTPQSVTIAPLSLNVGEGTLACQFNNEKASLQAQNLPIDILSLNPFDIPIRGSIDLDCSLFQTEQTTDGTLFARISDLEIPIAGRMESSKSQGEIKGHLADRTLKISTSFTHLQGDLSLPVEASLSPWKWAILKREELNGHLSFSGPIEQVFDFVNLGTHRIEGECLTQLTLSHTWQEPHLRGSCEWLQGFYQNYYTGTELHNIHALLDAKGTTLQLASFSAQDPEKKGTLKAIGNMRLLPEENFPYTIDLTLSDFHSRIIDLVDTEAKGHLSITGNLKEALASGHLDLLKTEILIPSRIPKPLPDLQVVYTNVSTPILEPTSPPKTPPFPLHLSLSVEAPSDLFISGRGLESEWKGQFNVGGTLTAIEAKGKIELIKGKFTISDREFHLLDGTLTLSGEKNEIPYLNLAGSMQIKDVLITAQLKGPLNNPQLTLQSSPPLPLGAIMAYLLFGQELTEINSFQAIQIVSAISSFAGEGPSVLEQTKKSLGVDRIQIISVPSLTAEGGETIAVEVGKYVAEDVLVSFSQGADASSTNIKIEVEGKGGISLLLESDQAQEQGKFTIRWSHIY